MVENKEMVFEYQKSEDKPQIMLLRKLIRIHRQDMSRIFTTGRYRYTGRMSDENGLSVRSGLSRSRPMSSNDTTSESVILGTILASFRFYSISSDFLKWS
jgi:hypothetical protein